MSKWVQHTSGQGEQWQVRTEYADRWQVIERAATGTMRGWLELPKSEYLEVPEPEVWNDVTQECEYRAAGPQGGGLYHNGKACAVWNGYRMRKEQVETRHTCGKTLANIIWAFIVEKRAP